MDQRVRASERLTGALLDRLTHHVHILEMNGNSFRLKHSKHRISDEQTATIRLRLSSILQVRSSSSEGVIPLALPLPETNPQPSTFKPMYFCSAALMYFHSGVDNTLTKELVISNCKIPCGITLRLFHLESPHSK